MKKEFVKNEMLLKKERKESEKKSKCNVIR